MVFTDRKLIYKIADEILQDVINSLRPSEAYTRQ